MIEYRIDEIGTKRLILTGEITNGIFKSDCCPFCGKQHTHGTPEGHRVAHCNHSNRSTVVATDGTELSPDDGYYIKDRNAIYADACPNCFNTEHPNKVVPVSDGVKGNYKCDNCNHSWTTWYGKDYKEFISTLAI